MTTAAAQRPALAIGAGPLGAPAGAHLAWLAGHAALGVGAVADCPAREFDAGVRVANAEAIATTRMAMTRTAPAAEDERRLPCIAVEATGRRSRCSRGHSFVTPSRWILLSGVAVCAPVTRGRAM
jgi:hypothetical protein